MFKWKTCLLCRGRSECVTDIVSCAPIRFRCTHKGRYLVTRGDRCLACFHFIFLSSPAVCVCVFRSPKCHGMLSSGWLDATRVWWRPQAAAADFNSRLGKENSPSQQSEHTKTQMYRPTTGPCNPVTGRTGTQSLWRSPMKNYIRTQRVPYVGK